MRVMSLCLIAVAAVSFWQLAGLTGCEAAPSQRRSAAARNSGVRNSGAKPASSQAMSAYLSSLRSKVLSQWVIPDGKNKVTITASVAADGSIQDTVLASTPKNDMAEIAGNEAFAKAQPLNPLPAGVNAPAKLVLTFESSADPHGDSSSNLYTQMFPAPQQKTEPAPATK